MPTAKGDERRIKQVLLNLIGNAIKFTDNGEVAVHIVLDDDHFKVSVSDTGPGISSADQARIFDEFQQADSSATREKGGTGLGLAIVKRIVELHGGTIGVESTLGYGSVFWITLPTIVEQQVGGSMTKRILSIEDQVDNRQIVRDLMTSAGYEVIEAVRGDEGVTLAEQSNPDLILMDIQLPGLDGYEATRRIKANPKLRSIPIIVVTSYALSGDEEKARAAGCDAYLAKPFDAMKLLAMVRQYLN